MKTTRTQKRNFFWIVALLLGIVALYLSYEPDLNWIPIVVYILAVAAWITGIYYGGKKQDK